MKLKVVGTGHSGSETSGQSRIEHQPGAPCPSSAPKTWPNAIYGRYLPVPLPPEAEDEADCAEDDEKGNRSARHGKNLASSSLAPALTNMASALTARRKAITRNASTEYKRGPDRDFSREPAVGSKSMR